jgi:hypothetical protein
MKFYPDRKWLCPHFMSREWNFIAGNKKAKPGAKLVRNRPKDLLFGEPQKQRLKFTTCVTIIVTRLCRQKQSTQSISRRQFLFSEIWIPTYSQKLFSHYSRQFKLSSSRQIRIRYFVLMTLCSVWKCRFNIIFVCTRYKSMKIHVKSRWKYLLKVDENTR